MTTKWTLQRQASEYAWALTCRKCDLDAEQKCPYLCGVASRQHWWSELEGDSSLTLDDLAVSTRPNSCSVCGGGWWSSSRQERGTSRASTLSTGLSEREGTHSNSIASLTLPWISINSARTSRKECSPNRSRRGTLFVWLWLSVTVTWVAILFWLCHQPQLLLRCWMHTLSNYFYAFFRYQDVLATLRRSCKHSNGGKRWCGGNN